MKAIKSESEKLRENLNNIKSDFEKLCELTFLNAKLTRAKYDALLQQGFTADQALELSKKLF